MESPENLDERFIYWRDPGGFLHACVSSQRVMDDDPDSFFVWTLCQRDVPPEEFYMTERQEAVSCPGCRAVLAKALGPARTH